MKLKEVFNGYINAKKYKRLVFWAGSNKFDVLTANFNYELFCKDYGNYTVTSLRDYGTCLGIGLKRPFSFWIKNKE